MVAKETIYDVLTVDKEYTVSWYSTAYALYLISEYRNYVLDLCLRL
jgi:hypothetical protein